MPTNTSVNGAGVYDLPIADYVNDPATVPSFNTRMAHLLLTKSPKHAWMEHPKLNPEYKPEYSGRMDLGTIAHSLFLEGDESRIEVIEADDWRTKAAKEKRDEARANYRVPILAKDMAIVREMVKVAVDKLYSSDLCEDFLAAEVEKTLVWQEGDTWCRARPDKLTPDGRIYFEFKTAQSAHPMAFARGPLISHGYDMQASLVIRGAKKLKRTDNCTVIYIVQEIEPPYAVSFVSLDPQFLSIANERLELALHQWRKCLATNNWPSYPSRVCHVSAPGYYGMDSLPEEACQ